MQLAYLLPFLDAEIDRLQRARDLLAFVPPPIDFSDEPATRSHPTLLASAEDKAAPPPASPAVTVLFPKRQRRSYTPRDPNRARKLLPPSDTALRGAVPSGPVVVSAEQVRKSQALKTAQATRAAEVKHSAAEPFTASEWRRPATDARSVDALLERLMHLGEDTDPQSPAPLPSLTERTPLASKLD